MTNRSFPGHDYSVNEPSNRVNAYNFPTKVRPEPQGQKQIKSNARESVVPNRHMENSSEELTKIVLKDSSVRPQKRSKRISKQKYTKKPEANHQPMVVNSENSSLSLHPAANSRKCKAVQAEINNMNVSDGLNRFNGTNSLHVREEINIFEKQISSKFSDAENHNEDDILKFDEELKTPNGPTIDNYANVVPTKSDVQCSAAENFSRHNQMKSEQKVEKEYNEKLEKCTEKLESRQSIKPDTVVVLSSISTEFGQAEMNIRSAPCNANYENDTRDLLVHEQAHIHLGDKLSNAEECNSKQDIEEDILRHKNSSHETQ